MYYAKILTSGIDPTVMEMHGRKVPHNFVIQAFPTQAERQTAIDTAWKNGLNGWKITRKEVAQYYGNDFRLYGPENLVNIAEYYPVDESLV